jgi:hypothetical protein
MDNRDQIIFSREQEIEAKDEQIYKLKERFFKPEIPYKEIINKAVEIAKKTETTPNCNLLLDMGYDVQSVNGGADTPWGNPVAESIDKIINTLLEPLSEETIWYFANMDALVEEEEDDQLYYGIIKDIREEIYGVADKFLTDYENEE